MAEKEEIEYGGLLGDLDWNTTRCMLVYGLMNCKTEEEFAELMLKIYSSMGTPKELAKIREEIGIHPFTEKDLDKIEKWENKKNN